MINAAIIRETSTLDDLSAHLRDFPAESARAIGAAFNRDVKPEMLQALQRVPGAAVHPFIFGSEQSRRWYFWAVGQGIIPTQGGRYQRTGQLVAGWQVDILVSDGAVVLSAKNPSRKLRFVTGDRQVRGHANTGWQRHEDVLRAYRGIASDTVDDTLTSLINRR